MAEVAKQSPAKALVGCGAFVAACFSCWAIGYKMGRDSAPPPPPPVAAAVAPIDKGPPRLTFRRLQEDVFSGEVGGWDGEQIQVHGRVMRYEPPREDAPHGFIIVHDPNDNTQAARCNFGDRAGNAVFSPGQLVSLTCTIGITALGGMLNDCFVGRD